uniref:Peptidase S1 domain-containing protein n=1 Tax=Timema monikensis TaxID=170555 RepID=A0A7R9E7M1_9NEOP|nr:unnamed protein product [Timema monikensis]
MLRLTNYTPFTVVQTFDKEQAVAITEANAAIFCSSVSADLSYVKSNFGNLPGAITSLEARDLPLVKAVKVMRGIEENLNQALAQLAQPSSTHLTEYWSETLAPLLDSLLTPVQFSLTLVARWNVPHPLTARGGPSLVTVQGCLEHGLARYNMHDTGDSPQGIKMAPTRLMLWWSITYLCVRQGQSLIILVPGAEDHPFVKLVNIQACLPQPVPLVAGGRMVMPTELPWLAVLIYKDNLRCGGSLINEQFILTAAHCLVDDDNRPRQLQSVVLGEHNRSSIEDCYEKQGRKICADTPISFLIEDIIVHPEYKPNMNNNIAKADIALIKLNKKAKLSDISCKPFESPPSLPHPFTLVPANRHHHLHVELSELHSLKKIKRLAGWLQANQKFYLQATGELTHREEREWSTGQVLIHFRLHCVLSPAFIKPICLPVERTEINITEFTTAGWGKTETNELSDVPMEVNVPYVPYKKCLKLLNDFNIPKSTICAGGQINKNSCQGDSGGPLAARAINSHNTYLMGIVSSGVSRRCGNPYPSVYTDVSAHLKWILDNLGGLRQGLRTEVSRTSEGDTGIKDLDMQGDEPVNSGSDQTWYRQILGSIPPSNARIADDPYIPKAPPFYNSPGDLSQNGIKKCWTSTDGAYHCVYRSGIISDSSGDITNFGRNGGTNDLTGINSGVSNSHINPTRNNVNNNCWTDAKGVYRCYYSSKSNSDNSGIDRFDINNGASIQNNPRGNNANKKICWDTADGAHHCSYSYRYQYGGSNYHDWIL